eukprot:2049511-Pleurochrysis_carterae.AAC.1
MGGNWRLRPAKSVAFGARTRGYESVRLTTQGASQSERSGSPSEFGPEGLNLAGNPFPLSLGRVWWCSTQWRLLPPRFAKGVARLTNVVRLKVLWRCIRRGKP